MDKTNMFGKTYNTIGSSDSNFLIKTKGDLKVLWGGKYIDIIKNGKIASSNNFNVKTIESSDNISGDGIYLIPTDNQIWVSIDNNTVLISNLDDIFSEELKETTPDLKLIALKNIGLIYNTLEEAKEVTQGMVFILDENKLYTANNGVLEPQKTFEMPKGSIIMFNGEGDIPEGWAICDGTNGTPDLINSFIKAGIHSEKGKEYSLANGDSIKINTYDLIFIMKV